MWTMHSHPSTSTLQYQPAEYLLEFVLRDELAEIGDEEGGAGGRGVRGVRGVSGVRGGRTGGTGRAQRRRRQDARS